jgi:hypothetical protein
MIIRFACRMVAVRDEAEEEARRGYLALRAVGGLVVELVERTVVKPMMGHYRRKNEKFTKEKEREKGGALTT